ncbi:MAG: hypothetical protein KBC95_01380 [Candidatus Peribacteraceae bacterium]|nr:hypothetical protein [Candidatus Peribacteraceae bacterium]
MRRFLASGWFPFVASLALLAGTLGGALWLPALPGNQAAAALGEQSALIQAAAWALGPLIALISFLIMGVLNGVRRLVRIRGVRVLHLLVILAGLAPWLILGWQLVLEEPRYTSLAIVVIDVFARPLLLGSLIATGLTLVLSLGLLLPSDR